MTTLLFHLFSDFFPSQASFIKGNWVLCLGTAFLLWRFELVLPTGVDLHTCSAQKIQELSRELRVLDSKVLGARYERI